ncbi:ABC transporter ATP-binding protein [Caproicibacter fermentans]|uniref:ABC transporter ATP-binding protein n=1 Tax=Caproicibacter fermentans TaxID=2576756 RepID=A0A7G8T6V7_9FIRM|nr:ABC transporter ATP-binding protein [Caproicibacter fermentans]QNK39348.1 ABC transporter ATP-binding protein [Caproicibacter fermentans]
MIEFKNISKYYRYKKIETNALDHISLKIDKNEMVAIMGPSGSGKTTLLNIAGALLTQSSGEYLFDHKPIVGNESEMARFRNNHIGFVLQHFALIKNRNVFYNIALPLKYQKMKKDQVEKIVSTVAESLGISNRLKMYPHMLSGGECQRVAIARAVVTHPNMILADEPTSSLDDDNKYEVLNILKRLNNCGATILIATHDNTVAQICDRKIQLNNGHIVE